MVSIPRILLDTNPRTQLHHQNWRASHHRHGVSLTYNQVPTSSLNSTPRTLSQKSFEPALQQPMLFQTLSPRSFLKSQDLMVNTACGQLSSGPVDSFPDQCTRFSNDAFVFQEVSMSHRTSILYNSLVSFATCALIGLIRFDGWMVGRTHTISDSS